MEKTCFVTCGCKGEFRLASVILICLHICVGDGSRSNDLQTNTLECPRASYTRMLVAIRRKISSRASFVNQGGCHACSAPFLFGLRNLRKEKGTDAYLRDKETINLPDKDLSPALHIRGGGAPASRKTARKIGPGTRGEGQREANKKTRNKKLPKRSIAKASARKRARIAKKKASAPTNNAEPDSREGEGSDDKIVDGVTRFDGANGNALPHESSQSEDYLQQRGGASSSDTDMTAGGHAGGEKGEAMWGQGGIGEILNAPGGPLDLGSMNTGSVGRFRPPEYEMFEEELKKLEFDGVFDVEHVNVSDPAVVHQLLHDIPLSVEKAYDALAEIGEATNAIREMEDDMSDHALGFSSLPLSRLSDSLFLPLLLSLSFFLSLPLSLSLSLTHTLTLPLSLFHSLSHTHTDTPPNPNPFLPSHSSLPPSPSFLLLSLSQHITSAAPQQHCFKP
jgi:hypothetical protein